MNILDLHYILISIDDIWIVRCKWICVNRGSLETGMRREKREPRSGQKPVPRCGQTAQPSGPTNPAEPTGSLVGADSGVGTGVFTRSNSQFRGKYHCYTPFRKSNRISISVVLDSLKGFDPMCISFIEGTK